MSLSKRGTGRENELKHHSLCDVSLDTQLCKLHIKVLTSGKLPKEYLETFRRHSKGKELTLRELKLIDLIETYVEQFGLPEKQIKWLTKYQEGILLALCDFIDDPLRCHGGKLAKLHQCKSIIKTLQFKQRVNLVKVVTALFSFMSVETGCLYRYANRSEGRVLDDSGFEQPKGVPHYEIRSRYHQFWCVSISKTKYFDCINMLKLAGFFEVESCYIANEAGEVRRQELRESGASIEDIAEIPRILSEAAYKYFTDAFFQVFSGLLHMEHMIVSKQKAVQSRIKRKLSLVYLSYAPNSSGFWTKKRKEFLWLLGKPRYSQAATPIPPDPTIH